MATARQHVLGLEVDNQTRCAHYHRTSDVVAIRFHCCNQWYACVHCHTAMADHQATVWPREAFSESAVMCGSCGSTYSIHDYLAAYSECTRCGVSFNPGCKFHHHLYFDIPS